MTISIALCTYNGAAFIADQLASYLAQTRLPDELVVCDDCSTDDTVDAIGRFAAKAPFPVLCHVNEVNLGFAQNFGRAVSLCSGDLIALSDQDDVWKPDKLARAERVLDEGPTVGLVCSEAEVVDQRLRPTGRLLLRSIGISDAERAQIAAGGALQVLLRRNFAMGASTTMRAALRAVALPIPPGWSHDWWFALAVALHADVALIDEPLVVYRQHGANQVGAPQVSGLGDLMRGSRLSRRQEFLRQLHQWDAGLQRIVEFGGTEGTRASEADLVDVRRRLAHVRTRAELPASRVRRVGPVTVELLRGNYRRYGAGLASAAKDLLLSSG